MSTVSGQGDSGRTTQVEGYFCPGCLTLVSQNLEVCEMCSKERPQAGWPKDNYLGRTIAGKYKLIRRIGTGGFAQVFLAKQVEAGHDLGEVVLKFLHQNLAQKENIRRRFINEAKAARQIRSPHAVKMFDLGFDEDGTPYLVMEYLEGESLQDLLSAHGRLPPERVLRLGLQVAGALDECHQKGIIHRDLKPDNLLLIPGRGEDFTKVLDFGIARVPDRDGTMTHTVMGTPRYMPPEQIMLEEMDGCVDIFALGVILYESLAGRPPIEAKTPMAYMQANLADKPTPLREVCSDLPVELENLLAQMMAKDRKVRPQSMADVESRLLTIGRANGWIAGRTGEIPVQKPARETKKFDEEGVQFDRTMPSMEVDEEAKGDVELAVAETCPPTGTGEKEAEPLPSEESDEAESEILSTSHALDSLTGQSRSKKRILVIVLLLGLVAGGGVLMFGRGDRGESSGVGTGPTMPDNAIEKGKDSGTVDAAASEGPSPDLTQVQPDAHLAQPDSSQTSRKRKTRPRRIKKPAPKPVPEKKPEPKPKKGGALDEEWGDRKGGL